MKSEKVKEMLDSCYMAKRILDMLPKLPEGVLPSYVRYLETIIELEEKNQKVKNFSYHFTHKTGNIIAYKTHGPIRRIKIWTQ